MGNGTETSPRGESREIATSVSRKHDIEAQYPVTREPTTDSAEEKESQAQHVQTLSPQRDHQYEGRHLYHDDVVHNRSRQNSGYEGHYHHDEIDNTRSRQNSTHSRVSEHSKRLEHGRPASVLHEHEYTKTTTVADTEAAKTYVVVGATPSDDPGIVFGRGLDTPVGGGFTVCHVIILFLLFMLFIVLLAVLV
jgi:hypothetical protein